MDKGKKKQTIAAALAYDRSKDAAPRVSARGKGVIAERILDLAREHGVPIKEDPALAQVLSRLDIDEQIPVELYRAVAEILAFVYRLNDRYRGTFIVARGKNFPRVEHRTVTSLTRDRFTDGAARTIPAAVLAVAKSLIIS